MVDNIANDDTLSQKTEEGQDRKENKPLNFKVLTAEDFNKPTVKMPPEKHKFYEVTFFPKTMQMQTTRILPSTNPSMLGKRPVPEANTPSSKIPSGRRTTKEQGVMSLATICNTPTAPSRPRKDEEQGAMSLTMILGAPKTPSRPRKEEEQGDMSLTTICDTPKF